MSFLGWEIIKSTLAKDVPRGSFHREIPGIPRCDALKPQAFLSSLKGTCLLWLHKLHELTHAELRVVAAASPRKDLSTFLSSAMPNTQACLVSCNLHVPLL